MIRFALQQGRRSPARPEGLRSSATRPQVVLSRGPARPTARLRALPNRQTQPLPTLQTRAPPLLPNAGKPVARPQGPQPPLFASASRRAHPPAGHSRTVRKRPAEPANVVSKTPTQWEKRQRKKARPYLHPIGGETAPASQPDSAPGTKARYTRAAKEPRCRLTRKGGCALPGARASKPGACPPGAEREPSGRQPDPFDETLTPVPECPKGSRCLTPGGDITPPAPDR